MAYELEALLSLALRECAAAVRIVSDQAPLLISCDGRSREFEAGPWT